MRRRRTKQLLDLEPVVNFAPTVATKVGCEPTCFMWVASARMPWATPNHDGDPFGAAGQGMENEMIRKNITSDELPEVDADAGPRLFAGWFLGCRNNWFFCGGGDYTNGINRGVHVDLVLLFVYCAQQALAFL